MSMTKGKIIILAVFFSIIGIISAMNSSDNSELSKENIVNDKNSDIAIKFTKYIYKYVRENNRKMFIQRFHRIPSEERERIITELIKMDKFTNPEKVTVPATGSERRFVYYKRDGKTFYKFIVSNSKSRWFFQDLAIVEAN